MWLLPEQLRSLSSLASEGSTSDGSAPPPDGLWATSSGTCSQRACSWTGWRTRPWSRRLSGRATSPSSTLPHFRGWSGCSGASPARTSAKPGPGPASAASAPGSGQSFSAPIATVEPGTCSLRTSQQSLFEDSTAFCTTLPKSGALRSGSAYERPMLAPRTGASAVSYSRNEYPTPSATPYGSSQNEGQVEHSRPSKGTPSLDTWARQMWPTVTAGDAKSSGSRNAPGSAAHQGVSLSDAVSTGDSAGRRWATPAARDYRTPNSAESQARRAEGRETAGQQLVNQVEHSFLPVPRETGETSSPPSSRRLNPGFVSWLMGLPWWWTHPERTSFAASEMASYRYRLRSLYESCCGASNSSKSALLAKVAKVASTSAKGSQEVAR